LEHNCQKLLSNKIDKGKLEKKIEAFFIAAPTPTNLQLKVLAHFQQTASVFFL